MMSFGFVSFENEKEEPLYDALNWAVQGLASTDTPDDKIPVDDFLIKLIIHDEDISGEPGWTIERLKTDKDFEKTYPTLNVDEVSFMKEMQQAGENEVFYVHNQSSNPEESMYNSKTFWTAVRRSLFAFSEENPDRQAEVDYVINKYSQIHLTPWFENLEWGTFPNGRRRIMYEAFHQAISDAHENNSLSTLNEIIENLESYKEVVIRPFWKILKNGSNSYEVAKWVGVSTWSKNQYAEKFFYSAFADSLHSFAKKYPEQQTEVDRILKSNNLLANVNK